MPDLNYPVGLPYPEKADHKPNARTLKSDTVGASLYANQARDYTGTVELEFFLSAAQTEIFYAWWQADLLEGGRWFNAVWPNIRPGGLVAQFQGEPSFQHVYDGAHRVSAKVQIRGSSLAVATLEVNPDLISLMHFEDDAQTINPRDELKILVFENRPLASPFSFVRPLQGKFGGGFQRFESQQGQIAGGLRGLPTSALSGKSWTGELWVRIDGAPFNIASEKRILSVGSVSIYSDPKFTIEGRPTSSANYMVGVYYHVCLEYWVEGAQLTLFVNGTPVSTRPGTTFNFFTEPTTTIAVGAAMTNGDYYKGAIDEWRLVGRALHKGQAFSPPTKPYTIYE